MRLSWLPDVLRDAGLTVVEHSGWQNRVIPGTWEPRYGVVHATAAPRSQPDSTQVAIVRDGRSDLDGPIAVACVDRTARWHVLGAGRCNTTLTGTGGLYKDLGNTYALGVEACNDNVAEPWPRAQYEAYYRGWAAICRRLGWTASNLVGHKEHTPGRKTDPTFSMGQFRADVAATLAGRPAGGMEQMFCDHGDRGLAVQHLQYRLKNLGHDPGAIDSGYGDKTASALAAAIKAYNGSRIDGRTYGPAQMIYLDVMWCRKYGGDRPGPAGPAGPQGPAGPAGPQGDQGQVDYERLVDGLLGRLAAVPPAQG